MVPGYYQVHSLLRRPSLLDTWQLAQLCINSSEDQRIAEERLHKIHAYSYSKYRYVIRYEITPLYRY